MATTKHKSILLLQATTPRLIDPNGSEALVITPTASTLTINENASAQLAAQNTVILSATCTRTDAVINWSTTQGTLSAATGTQVTLTYSTVPVVDMSNITVTATTSADSKYSPTTLTKIATITKTAPAKNILELTLYQRFSGAPGALPSGITYNTSTKALAGTLNGWSLLIPTGTTDPIYITKATVEYYNATTNYARPVSQWQAAAKMQENGTSGQSGDSVDIIYIRQAQQPTPPAASAGTPAGWYSNVQQVPLTDDPMWASTGTKTAGIGNYTWDTPVKITGSNIVEVTLYIKASSTPAVPSGATYNFSTKVIQPGSNGWQIQIPDMSQALSTESVYTTRATVSTDNPAASAVQITGWSQPTVSMKNGQNGQDATVTATNIKNAIESGSSTTINLANHQEFFKSSASANTGVFIGSNGIYGKNGGTVNFAVVNSSTIIDGITIGAGQAYFKGTITGGSDIDISGKAIFGGTVQVGSTPVTVYTKTSSTSDVGIFGLTSKQGQVGQPTVINQGVQGRVADQVTFGNTSVQYAAGIAGINYSDNAQSYAGYFNAANRGGYAILAEGGVIYLDQGQRQLYLTSSSATQGLNLPPIIQLNGQGTKLSYLNNSSQPLELNGNAPIIKFVRTSVAEHWWFSHETGNFVVRNGTTNGGTNLMVISSVGDLLMSGNVTAYSDKAIKTHIRPISQATSKLKQINGYQYKNLLANKHDCGIIAQEIEKILPELVQVGSTEYEGTQLKTVNYNGVVALLVAANRELIARVEALEKQVHANSTGMGKSTH